MCYSPITIVNPSKYISIHYKDRFLLQVPCGQCAECQQRKSSEWAFRTYYEFVHTYEVDSDSYVYFDTLTYDSDYLPYMDEIHMEFPHVPCFRSKDITGFLKRVRISLSRKFGIDSDAFSYFICSEYGSLKLRPHYHILLFMRRPIDPYKLSLLVSKSWKFGRTDGIPYKSAHYVDRHNVLKHSRIGNVYACTKYVTKYVEKDCKMQDVIDKRIKQASLVLGNVIKQDSVEYKKTIRRLVSEVNQFHVQSLYFGELALRDIDLTILCRTGCVTMPSHDVVSFIPLPMYYHRKMFYERYQLNGMLGWQLTHFGKEFNKQRQSFIYSALVDRYKCLCQLANVQFDCEQLAHYVLFERGRFKDGLDESTIEERLPNVTHYLYSCQTDKDNVGAAVTLDFVGNSALGYVPFDASRTMKIKDFIDRYVYTDDTLEQQLKVLFSSSASINDGAQKYYSRCQELKSLFKSISFL